jgi:hypothetical protein
VSDTAGCSTKIEQPVVFVKEAPVISPTPKSLDSVRPKFEQESNVPKSFSFESTTDPVGIHHVLREGIWFEQYPNGAREEFRVTERISLNGCFGTLLYRANLPILEVFVPDDGCMKMEYKVRVNKGDWRAAGKMINIE